ncbi:hypothetical protein DY000_02030942 [Brassica cretica]|uniref:Uncharacterized protein n=1 Tax=Brassica cretica TaxID=69181 RepID=A0ABQ7DV82_BRACR|nr:hypothetical protein DY000_02030942 [Brassica cretica]
MIHLSSSLCTGSPIPAKLRQENPQRFCHHRRVQRPQITGNPKESVPKNLTPVSCFRDSPWHKVQEESTPSEANPRTPLFSNGANRHRQTRHQDSGAFVENHRTRPTRHTETVRETPPIFTESRMLHQVERIPRSKGGGGWRGEVDIYAVIILFVAGGRERRGGGRERRGGGHGACGDREADEEAGLRRLVPSTDTRSPLSTDNTHLPLTNVLHPTSIDTPSQTSIDTEPRDMVAPLILVRDNNGDLHDQEGHLPNAAGSGNQGGKRNSYGNSSNFNQNSQYMPSSARSNKETQLLFSQDLASLERSIRKEVRSSSTDNTTCVSLDSAQPPSTQTLVPSTDTRSPLSTDNTHLPSTNILHPTSIDTPSQTSIDTELRDMVAPLILVRDNNGNLHDQEGHLRNAAVVKEEKVQEGDFEVESLMSFGGSQWCRSTPDLEHRSTYTSPNRSIGTPEHRSTMPTESTASCNDVKILTHEEFAAKHPHPPSPFNA